MGMMLWLILLIIIIYLMIGAFIATLLTDRYDEPQVWIIMLWPLLVAAYLLLLIVSLPVKLGEYVRDKRKRR